MRKLLLIIAVIISVAGIRAQTPVKTAFTCYSCAGGSYCPANSSAPHPCPAGFYCPARSGNRIVCARGEYCPAGTQQSHPCPAGSYCTTTSQIAECDPGDYCPKRSTAKERCPAGSYCATPAEIAQCAPGDSCPEGSTEKSQCPRGYYCTAMEAVPVECTVPKSCPAGSSANGCTSGMAFIPDGIEDDWPTSGECKTALPVPGDHEITAASGTLEPGWYRITLRSGPGEAESASCPAHEHTWEEKTFTECQADPDEFECGLEIEVGTFGTSAACAAECKIDAYDDFGLCAAKGNSHICENDNTEYSNETSCLLNCKTDAQYQNGNCTPSGGEYSCSLSEISDTFDTLGACDSSCQKEETTTTPGNCTPSGGEYSCSLADISDTFNTSDACTSACQTEEEVTTEGTCAPDADEEDKFACNLETVDSLFDDEDSCTSACRITETNTTPGSCTQANIEYSCDIQGIGETFDTDAACTSACQTTSTDTTTGTCTQSNVEYSCDIPGVSGTFQTGESCTTACKEETSPSQQFECAPAYTCDIPEISGSFKGESACETACFQQVPEEQGNCTKRDTTYTCPVTNQGEYLDKPMCDAACFTTAETSAQHAEYACPTPQPGGNGTELVYVLRLTEHAAYQIDTSGPDKKITIAGVVYEAPAGADGEPTADWINDDTSAGPPFGTCECGGSPGANATPSRPSNSSNIDNLTGTGAKLTFIGY